LELRIYEAGKSVRAPAAGAREAWPRDSTHIIPVKLSEALDPRNVGAFSLYYRSASPLAPELEIVRRDVELPSKQGAAERLLDATLSGVITRQGELANHGPDQAALMCRTDRIATISKPATDRNGVHRAPPAQMRAAA